MTNILIPEKLYYFPAAILLHRLNVEKTRIVVEQKEVKDEEKKQYRALTATLLKYCEQMSHFQDGSYFQFDIVDDSTLLVDEKIIFKVVVNIEKEQFIVNILTNEEREKIEFKLTKRRSRLEKEKIEHLLNLKPIDSTIQKL